MISESGFYMMQPDSIYDSRERYQGKNTPIKKKQEWLITIPVL